MTERRAIFISHATPDDNPFTLWLGAKLAALGYEVWADVLQLKGGDDWQRKLEEAIRSRACKLLLVANQKAIEKQGVRNEIQIASDVARKISDPNFIIPLRLAPFDAPFLIAQAQYIDFSQGWSKGLHDLLLALQHEYKVPHAAQTSTNVWTALQGMNGRVLEKTPERLVSNWLRVKKLPSRVFYYRNADLRRQGITLSLPSVPYGDGYITCEEHNVPSRNKSLNLALGIGWPELGVAAGEMRRMFSSLANQGMELFLRSCGLTSYEMAGGRLAWCFTGESMTGRLPFVWGDLKGSRVLRGFSERRKLHWHYGISAYYRGGPVRYFRLRGRVSFSEDGTTILPGKRMHRMRRSFTKSWRNARWRDMFLTMLYVLSDKDSQLKLPLSRQEDLVVEVPPVLYLCPVSIPESRKEVSNEEEDADDLDAEDDFVEEDSLEEEF